MRRITHCAITAVRYEEDGMPKASDVTIIIPNYNGKKLLENCIETLERQTCLDFKLLVVDNGSTDGSVDVASEVLNMEVIALPENTGFCGAVNTGIRHTQTPYFILLNNDTETEPAFVEALLAGIGKSERIFSCGAMMIDYHNHELIDNAGDYYTALGWAVARAKGRKVCDYETEWEVFSCCGGASIYRTDVARKIGLFDENHFAYLEDVDVGYRARIYGYRNYYIPQAKVFHVGSATTGTRYNEKKVFLAARNSMYLIYKNMPLLQMILNLPLILAGIVIKLLFFLRKGLAGEYLKGIGAGISGASKCRKVQFRMKDTGNYVRIQLSLWGNILRVIFGR